MIAIEDNPFQDAHSTRALPAIACRRLKSQGISGERPATHASKGCDLAAGSEGTSLQNDNCVLLLPAASRPLHELRDHAAELFAAILLQEVTAALDRDVRLSLRASDALL